MGCDFEGIAMTNPISPEETYALVVGIEKYKAGSGWDLNGPANDAIQFVNWLLERKVNPENIHLFLSPLDTNRNLIQNTTLNYQAANQENIINAIIYELLSKDVTGELLYVFWLTGRQYSPKSLFDKERSVLW
jgi:hypothetical protein